MRRSPRRAAISVGVLTVVAAGPVTAGLSANATPSAGNAHGGYLAARSAQTSAAKAVLGSVNANATATGIRAPLYSHAGEDVEAEIPYAVAQLGGGGVGHAVTSIVWPGATGAHGGSTIGVLGIKGLPPSLVNSLNDPYVAEAPTVTGADTVDKSNQAVQMKAVAKSDNVLATSAFGPGSTGPLSSVGGITTTTHIVQKKHIAIIDARSQMTNVTIGGVLTIGSLISTAHATTNGKTANGTTQSQISGVKVAGVNVSIDQNGIELTGKGLLPPSVLKVLSNTVNTALKQIGLKILLAPGTKSIHKAQIHLDSGDLIIQMNKKSYKANANDTGMVLQLGGASIDAIATPGYVPPVTTTTTSPTPQPASSQPTTTTGTGPVTPTGPTVNPPPAPAASQAANPGATPVVAANPLAFKGPLGWGYVVLALLLAGLVAAGLKRFPDEVLKPNGPACNLEDGA